MPEIEVSLCITNDGNVDFSKITQQLGITPTKVRKKDEFPMPSIKAGVAHNEWVFSMQKEESKAVSKQLDKLQKMLMPKTEIIKELCEKYKLKTTIAVVVEMEVGDGPEMVLTKENIQFLASIGAEIGFDMYID